MGGPWRPHLVDDWAQQPDGTVIQPPRTWEAELSEASAQVALAIQHRNETMRAARRAGLTLPQIGAAVGLTKQGVTYHIR